LLQEITELASTALWEPLEPIADVAKPQSVDATRRTQTWTSPVPEATAGRRQNYGYGRVKSFTGVRSGGWPRRVRNGVEALGPCASANKEQVIPQNLADAEKLRFLNHHFCNRPLASGCERPSNIAATFNELVRCAGGY